MKQKIEETLLAAPEVVEQIPLNLIIPSKLQPRTTYSRKDLELLSRSIQAVGVIEPIILRQLSSGVFEIICGHRRVIGAKKAGLRTVPGIIRNLDDHDVLRLQIFENLYREKLTDTDAQMGVKRWKNLKTILKHFKPERIKREDIGISEEFEV